MNKQKEDKNNNKKEDKIAEVAKALTTIGWSITKIVFFGGLLVFIIVILVMCLRSI
jgi:hypothetical protein